MCHFITGTVAAGSDLDPLNEALDELDLRFTPVHNPHVQAQLPPKLVYGTWTEGMCDCNTPLGAGRLAGSVKPVAPHKIRKMRRRGWSEERIRTWSEQKMEAKRRSAAEDRKINLAALESWSRAIHTAVTLDLTPTFGLLKHWYGTGVADERFRLSVVQVEVEQATPEFLTDIPEDVLHVFG